MITMPYWPKPLPQQPSKFDLDRITKLLDLLGNPERNTPPIIHVAGTNGKGSTIAFLRAILEQAGLKVHCYTSPHLIEYNERIVLASEKITDDQYQIYAEQVKGVAEKYDIQPTFFEGMTAIAFLAFSKIKADYLLLETGLGGRLDPTNVIESPILTVITSISYDHMEYLGPSLKLIAAEKAGIIKNNVPCISSLQDDEVYEVLQQKCLECNAPFISYEYDYGLVKTQDGWRYIADDFEFLLPQLSLLGDHQNINAATAITAINALNKINFNTQRQVITNHHITYGLQKAYWPARLQKVGYSKLLEKFISQDKINIYVDGAHNIPGAQMLNHWAKDHLSGPIILMLGLTKGRDVAAFIVNFKDCVDVIYAVPVIAEPDSYNSDILVNKGMGVGIPMVACDSIEHALISIEEDYLSNDKAVKANLIIAGSLYLAGDFLKMTKQF